MVTMCVTMVTVCGYHGYPVVLPWLQCVVTMVTVCGYHGYPVVLPWLEKLPASVSVSLALVTFTVVGSGELLHLTLVDPLYQLQVPPVPGGVRTTKYTGPIFVGLSENFQHGRFDCIAT